MRIRRATAADASALWELLAVAVFADPPWTVEQVRAEPSLAHYLDGWPRPGDEGVLAVRPGRCGEEGGGRDEGGDRDEVLGAAWYRFLPAAEPGYGFVDPSVPELTIAGHARWEMAPGVPRGQRLMDALMVQARGAGVESLSLSVDPANARACRLYERCGFQVVDTDPGGSLVMVGATG